jgi:hypothetical protein
MEIANAINLTEIQMSGTARVAAIEQNRVQFANQIAKALHDGDNALAKQLGKQQAINDLQVEANELLKSPAQKAKEAKEQRKNEVALRVAAAQDKARGEGAARDKEKFIADNAMRVAHGLAPLPMPEHFGPVRAGDRGSRATRKAIQDAAERNAPKNVGAAQNQINEFVAKTLIVTAVKSK